MMGIARQYAGVLGLFFILLFLCAGEGWAKKVYIWEDEGGQTHFSDSPPAEEEGTGRIEERKFKEPPPPEEAAPPVARTPIEHAVLCTFRIKNKKGGASGFFINDKGLAVTAKHVVEGATYSMEAELFGDTQERRVRILKRSRHHDLALLQINIDRPTPYLQIRDPQTLVPGEGLWAVGNPLLAFKETVTQGNFSRIFPEEDWKKEVKMKRPPHKYRGDWVQFTTPVMPGNSGGPVIDSEGKLVGVVSLSYKLSLDLTSPLNFAVPSSYIEKDFASYLE